MYIIWFYLIHPTRTCWNTFFLSSEILAWLPAADICCSFSSFWGEWVGDGGGGAGGGRGWETDLAIKDAAP